MGGRNTLNKRVVQLLEQMTATQKTITSRLDKIVQKSAGGGNNEGGEHSRDQQKKCTNCGTYHEALDVECLNLEANASKCPEGYVISFGYRKKK